jgi:hypothetical protein
MFSNYSVNLPLPYNLWHAMFLASKVTVTAVPPELARDGKQGLGKKGDSCTVLPSRLGTSLGCVSGWNPEPPSKPPSLYRCLNYSLASFSRYAQRSIQTRLPHFLNSLCFTSTDKTVTRYKQADTYISRPSLRHIDTVKRSSCHWPDASVLAAMSTVRHTTGKQ